MLIDIELRIVQAQNQIHDLGCGVRMPAYAAALQLFRSFHTVDLESATYLIALRRNPSIVGHH